jgi:hypothetical protein
MIRRLAVAAVSLSAFAAADATAEAKVFRGKTSGGRAASVVVGSDGLVRNARINWRASCAHGVVHDKTAFTRPHDASTPDSLLDAGTYRSRDKDGERLRFTVRIKGTRDFDPAHPERERWHGSFRAKVLVSRRGRYVDTCRVRALRWTARLVR